MNEKQHSESSSSNPSSSQNHTAIDNKQKFIVFGVLALVIAGMAVYSSVIKPSSLKNKAKKIVAYDLMDPNSAQFRNVKIFGSSKVCGEVNGKNAVGAYTGFKWFVADIFPNGNNYVKFEDAAILGSEVAQRCPNHPANKSS